MAEFYFYIVCIIILGGWLAYKGYKHNAQYMSDEWMERNS